MRSRLLAAIAGIVAAGSFAGYLSTLTTPERTQLRSDLATLASQDPTLIPLVAKVCPTCTVDPKCWRLASTGDICRHDGTIYRRYGPGIGGVNRDGTPATCTPVAGTDEPWPCTGDSAEWPAKVKALRDAGVDRDMVRAIEERLRSQPDEAGGDP